MQTLLEILMAAVSSVGFSLLFGSTRQKLPAAAAGGAFTWGCYLLVFRMTENRVLGFFIGTLAAALLAEVLARRLKTPVIALLVPLLIPLIPGGDLYYSTLALVQGDMVTAAQRLSLLARETLAIACGVILATCLVQTVLKIRIHVGQNKRPSA